MLHVQYVDSHTMTVTLFEAVRPPSVVLLCAAEGSIYAKGTRLLVSALEWMTGTVWACYRGMVLRLETPVLEKTLSRVSRVKLGIRS